MNSERIEQIRERVKAYGGMFHGPRIEHLSMPETSFFAFMAEQDTALTAANERAERAEQALHGALRYADEAGRFAETIATLEAENARLRGIVAKVPSAINAAFAAGTEERDGGSANRQQKHMDTYEPVRKAARQALEDRT